MAETHEGWSNYETWCVNLWLSKDSAKYSYWTACARAACAASGAKAGDKADMFQYRRAVGTLSSRMCEEIGEDGNDQRVEGFWSDMLGAALSRVDYREIAAHWIAGVLS